ncbi:MAG: hypothetical protein KAQ94_06610 [Arcobacteraceae bacterium]|nr:hypothetical protein [Arcobacteraceae bacterium]
MENNYIQNKIDDQMVDELNRDIIKCQEIAKRVEKNNTVLTASELKFMKETQTRRAIHIITNY